MKVSTKPRRRKTRTPAWHAEFLRMLPRIQESASVAFRHLTPEAQQEAVQDVTVGALVAFVRLVSLGKAHLAFPTVLARFGVAQFRSGRRVASPLNGSDVLSPYAQRQKKFGVTHLHHYCRRQNELLVENGRTTPADVATMRIDFAEWLESLSRRQRRIANLLASGETTGGAAKQLRVSPGRISQIRRELEQSWQAFQGECFDSDAA